MNSHRSPKKEIIRRVLVYALMTMTTLVLLVILTFTVMGYRFNVSDYKVEQTGLVQFNSFPRGATVYVNGGKTDSTTSAKRMVSEGAHRFEMKLKGYETWQKSLTIRAGTVTWLDYARMVPLEKQVATIEGIPGVADMLSSPDRRFWAGSGVASNTGLPTWVLIDFYNTKQPKVDEVELDASLFNSSAVSHKLTPVEWDKSGRYVLLRYDYQSKDGSAGPSEWLWLDRDFPTGAINLSALVNLSLQSVAFSSAKELFVLQDNGDMRQLSVDSGAISRPVLSGVKEFDVFDRDTVAYVSQTDNEQIAGVWRKGWALPSQVMSAPSTSAQELKISVSKYFSKDTVVVSDGEKVLIGRGSLLASYAEKDVRAVFAESASVLSVNHSVESVSASANGRFIIINGQNMLTNYDLERKSIFRNLPNNNGARWLDSYYLWQINTEGYLEIEEFDGTNKHSLLPADPQRSALLTSDGKYLYSFLINEEGATVLQRLSMTVS